jgi:hypothetical protein
MSSTNYSFPYRCTVLTHVKIRSTSNKSLLATLHFKNTYTMSDYEYNYDEDEDLDDEYDDDGLRINGRRVEDLEDIKDYERGIMLAEKRWTMTLLVWVALFSSEKGTTVALKVQAGQFVYCWKRKKTTMKQRTRKTTMKQQAQTSNA